MANRARGETAIEVPGVGEVILCLTLAGMAYLEDAFEVDSLEDAVAKVSESPSSRSLATVLHALTLGGDKSYPVEEIRNWGITPAAIKDAMGAMNAANEATEGNASGEANRKARRTRAAQPRGKSG